MGKTRVADGHGGEPGGAGLFAGPPLAGGIARFGEMIAIEDGADI